jgi:L-aminopeptidase/D-esterase-like protein
MSSFDQTTEWQLDPGPTNSLVDVDGVLVGHYSHPDVYRGATAVLTPEGALASVSVRGSNPGTIETDALRPVAIDVYVHGVSLCGGSLFGLSAARGIMNWCQENDIGLHRRGIWLPVVPGAVIYDLNATDPRVLPTSEWGYMAASAAARKRFARGNVGAGCGGTAGKGEGCIKVKGGLGTASLQLPEGIVVGALAVVNSLGGPIEPETGRLYARQGGHDRPRLFLPQRDWASQPPPEGNTTLGVIATNCALEKTQLAKIAELTHNGFARVIRPMHTMLDGDAIFTLSAGGDAKIQLDLDEFMVTDMIGAAAADAMVLAVLDAFMQAEGIDGFPACRDLVADLPGQGH